MLGVLGLVPIVGFFAAIPSGIWVVIIRLMLFAPTGCRRSPVGTMEPGAWARDEVPLDVAVRPRWTIRNSGAQAFSIGPPNAENRKGCCPGPFALHGPATVEPGDEISFSFELAMHPGMHGLRDMTVHVPVTYATGTTATIDGSVTGDFRS